MRSLHFLYHELRSTQTSYSYVTPREEFQAHCQFFARASRQDSVDRYRPVITFDDGNASDATIAQPTLEQYGLRAFFFITAGWTQRRLGFLTWGQLRALRASGHQIGAHGMTHALLTRCNDAQLGEELSGARNRLEDGIGEAVRSMSLPGGRMSRRVLQACEQAGFEQIYTSIPRAESVEGGQRTIGRLNLVQGTTVTWLEQVLTPESGVLAGLERKAHVKALAKSWLGDRLYGHLWAMGNRQEPGPDGAEVLEP